MQEDDLKKIKMDNLERKLYSRNAPKVIDPGRSQLKNEDIPVKESWEDVKMSSFDELASRMSQVAHKKHSFVKKFLVVSIVLFLGSVGVAAFVFLGGVNLVSSKNVDIKVVGPISIPAGQEVSLDLNVINNNNTELNTAAMVVEYPEGTRSALDVTKELTRERFDLETIKSGENYTQNIKAIFFGEKDSLKQIKINLEYRVENSSALFYKEKIYEMAIASAPVIVTPIYPKEVNSNQEIYFDIEVASNSKDEIDNFLVNVEYPFGFVLQNSSPQATYGNNTWSLDNLKPAEKRKISIRGSIIGQNNEERVFKISAGTASEADERRIGVPIASLSESIMVKKPFIGLGVNINGQSGNYAGSINSNVNATLAIRNNLPSRLFNVSVETSMKGSAYDRLKVVPGENGFFQSFNDTILWDKRAVVEFGDMPPGEAKNISFILTPLPYSSIPQGSKPEIEVTIKAKGERVLESGSVETVEAIETRKITFGSSMALSSKTFRSLGNIENSGPIPPKADTPTTYTVEWSLSNTFNQISNVEVRATLPSYVKWTGVKTPSNENINYNPVTNEIVWSVGSLLPNAGFSSPKKQAYFQVEIVPSINQVNEFPQLIGESKATGIDKVTGAKIESVADEVTTKFSGDPTFKQGDEFVVR